MAQTRPSINKNYPLLRFDKKNPTGSTEYSIIKPNNSKTIQLETDTDKSNVFIFEVNFE